MAELVFFSDVLCPWSTVIALRLRAARARAGAEGELVLVHRAMPLELMFETALPRRVVDAEIPVCAALTPEFGWSLWQGRPEEYPVTGLPALEAVQAAARQSPRAADELDLALRRAFFSSSRCIGLRHEILAAAQTCPSVDVDGIRRALDSGSCREAVSADYAAARAAGIECSGTVVLPDGTAHCNPGTRTGWIGGTFPRGTPTLVEDRPEVYDEIVAAALAA